MIIPTVLLVPPKDSIWFSNYRVHQKLQESLLKIDPRASLVAQWLGVPLPMQGTRVRALVWEDPTCHGATEPMRHNY